MVGWAATPQHCRRRSHAGGGRPVAQFALVCCVRWRQGAACQIMRYGRSMYARRYASEESINDAWLDFKAR